MGEREIERDAALCFLTGGAGGIETERERESGRKRERERKDCVG